MAAFNINCPHCGGTLEVQDEWADMETACPLCSKAFIVPRRAIPAAPPVPRAAVPQPVSQPPAGGYPQAAYPGSESGQLPELYNPNSAGWWSLLLTPVFGSWCIWQNYKTLGDAARAQRSLIWIIILPIILIATSAYGGGLILLIVWCLAEQQPQVKMLEKRAASLGVDKAYSPRSLLNPVLIGIAAEIVLILLIAVATKIYINS